MRFYRITFVGGLAIGYVLGAQAGRERYEQLKRLARKATESPAMQQTAGALQAQATSTAKSARSKASATVRSARDQAAAKVTGVRKSSSKLARRRSEQGKAAREAAEVPSVVPQPTSEDQRPFVPVNGGFGDDDVMP